MLSIIIPTLNEEKHLFLLLKSICSQDFKDYEIIVADAGSQDKTLKIAQSFGCRLVKGGLPARGRNEGAKVARGDLFLFLDADTLLDSGSLKKFLEEFQARNLEIATCLLKPFKESCLRNTLANFFYNFPLLTFGKIFHFGAGFFLVKKSLHQKIEGFDEKVRLLEDVVYFRKASKFGRFGVLKSAKIFFSLRRFEEEGWIKTYLKILFAFCYTILVGPIESDIFQYHFGRHR